MANIIEQTKYFNKEVIPGALKIARELPANNSGDFKSLFENKANNQINGNVEKRIKTD